MRRDHRVNINQLREVDSDTLVCTQAPLSSLSLMGTDLLVYVHAAQDFCHDCPCMLQPHIRLWINGTPYRSLGLKLNRNNLDTEDFDCKHTEATIGLNTCQTADSRFTVGRKVPRSQVTNLYVAETCVHTFTCSNGNQLYGILLFGCVIRSNKICK